MTILPGILVKIKNTFVPPHEASNNTSTLCNLKSHQRYRAKKQFLIASYQSQASLYLEFLKFSFE